MDISIPVTIQVPGATVHTPFGDIAAAPTQSNSTAVLHIDAPTQALLIQVLTGTSPTKLTPAELAALYSVQDLLSALTIAETPKSS
jgi:hypothetical protein